MLLPLGKHTRVRQKLLLTNHPVGVDTVDHFVVRKEAAIDTFDQFVARKEAAIVGKTTQVYSNCKLTKTGTP